MAGARDLVLWLLDQGYQPQHLKPNFGNDPALLVETCQEEINALETSGRSDLIEPFQQQLRNVGLEFQDQDIQETDIWMQHAVASAELSEELRQQLDQAIDLRTQGEGETSLALLEHLAEEGIRSPWLADNQARVLVNLQRKPEALEIWAALGRSPHASVAEQAQAMDQQVRQATIQQLLEQATQIAARADHNIQSLSAWDVQTLEELELPLLKEAIHLRDNGHPSESLELLYAAEDAGLNSGWIDDNKARALVDVGRRAEAIALWRSLENHPDEGLRTMAMELVVQQSGEQLQSLRDNLSRICLEQGWVAQELQSPAESMDTLEQAVLKESIRSRDAGQAATSLLLIEAAQAEGLNSPWLKDNQARALVNLERLPEAVELWRELEALSDQEALSGMAREMLEKYAAEGNRLAATQKAEDLANQGQIEQAKTLLVRAMLADPSWDGYTSSLKQMLKMERVGNSETDLLEQELEDDRLNLQAFDVYLDLVEQRLKDAAAGSSN